MARSILLTLVGVFVAACGAFNREPPATAEECARLLESTSASQEQLVAFADRADRALEAAAGAESDPSLERLGLCTGALKRKAGLLQ